MTTVPMPQCLQCKHLHRQGKGWRCDAFPRGIPARIIYNEVLHDQPYPGDNGILFEAADEYKGSELLIRPLRRDKQRREKRQQ